MKSWKQSAFVARLRDPVERFAARRVRVYVDGSESIYPGDPGRRIEADPTSWAEIRLIQHSPHDGQPVKVGKYCALNHKAAIFHGGQHRLDWVGVVNCAVIDGDWIPAEGVPVSRGQVVIGNDVYVGYEALIMSGVTIGDGAVVSARSWVTRSIEPYGIVAGNPARHIGWRFDEEVRAALLRIRWWDWPEALVQERMGEINSADVDGFVRRYDPVLARIQER